MIFFEFAWATLLPFVLITVKVHTFLLVITSKGLEISVRLHPRNSHPILWYNDVFYGVNHAIELFIMVFLLNVEDLNLKHKLMNYSTKTLLLMLIVSSATIETIHSSLERFILVISFGFCLSVVRRC